MAYGWRLRPTFLCHAAAMTSPPPHCAHLSPSSRCAPCLPFCCNTFRLLNMGRHGGAWRRAGVARTGGCGTGMALSLLCGANVPRLRASTRLTRASTDTSTGGRAGCGRSGRARCRYPSRATLIAGNYATTTAAIRAIPRTFTPRAILTCGARWRSLRWWLRASLARHNVGHDCSLATWASARSGSARGRHGRCAAGIDNARWRTLATRLLHAPESHARHAACSGDDISGLPLTPHGRRRRRRRNGERGGGTNL